ncbi:unnamed protein product [Arabidopsis lyrata]|nr:unnamed protein product [Arabidopsis lyrata]
MQLQRLVAKELIGRLLLLGNFCEMHQRSWGGGSLSCDYGREVRYPVGNDVFTALLLALPPPQTWLGIKDQALQNKMNKLVSVGTLSTMQHEEAVPKFQYLIFGAPTSSANRNPENKEEEYLTGLPN